MLSQQSLALIEIEAARLHADGAGLSVESLSPKTQASITKDLAAMNLDPATISQVFALIMQLIQLFWGPKAQQ